MAKMNAPLLALNRGEVSKLALARIDVERLRLAAETQINYMPTVLGPAMMRPGLGNVAEVRGDAKTRGIPFVFGLNDTALLEFTAGHLRILINDAVVTRPAVSTSVTSGDFSASTGWTLVTSGGGVATISGGVLTLSTPSEGGVARAKQQITVASGDHGKEHGLRITVDRGPVTVRIGSTDGADDYVSETSLDTGVHSLAFTPSTDAFLQIETITARNKVVSDVAIDGAGALDLPTPYAESDLPLLRTDQSGDVVFVACHGKQQRKIERRATHGWSVVAYSSDDGPFNAVNITDITLTPGALNGNTTLTATRPLFKAGEVGVLYRLFSVGQEVSATLAAENTFSNTIRVTGVGTDRTFNIDISGTFTATVTLQRSVDGPDSGFKDIQSYTTPTTTSYADSLDNSIVWYRLGIKTGDYTDGAAAVSLSYVGGGGAGIARVLSVASSTVANVEVITPFSSLTATKDWHRGAWSDLDDWPAAVCLHEGRAWWFRGDRMWGSASDDYYSFTIDATGDAAPIDQTFGSGAVDIINWGLSLLRLIVGREMSEASIRSSAFDAPLTPTNFSVKDCSTHGSARLPALKVDQSGIFVDKAGRRVYELTFDSQRFDYVPRDLTRLNLDIGRPGFTDAAVARQPDTALMFPRGDGQLAVLLYEPADDVVAWWRVVTAGQIENVVVLPGALEDQVYVVVARTVAGRTRRYWEKFARRDECTGGTINKIADSFTVYSGAPISTLTGLTHLAECAVVVWADGKALAGPFTVNNLGTLALGGSYRNVVVGLGYTAQFRSAKLAYGAQRGTALTQKKKIDHLGLVAFDMHPKAVTAGQSFDTMDALPLIEDGAAVDQDAVWPAYDKPMSELPGEWDTDARLCLQTEAPYPATIAGLVVGIDAAEKV